MFWSATDPIFRSNPDPFFCLDPDPELYFSRIWLIWIRTLLYTMINLFSFFPLITELEFALKKSFLNKNKQIKCHQYPCSWLHYFL